MARKPQLELPRIDFEPTIASEEERASVLEVCSASEGFPAMTLMCVDTILRRVDLAVFDFTAQSVSLRYQIDGQWTPMPPMDRETGDKMLATLKQMASMNWQDRRSRQEGKFRTLFQKNRYEFRVISQGVKTGERVAVYVGRKREPLETLTDLGMREGLRQQISGILNSARGISVCGAVKGEGLTACWRGFLAGGDRFLRDYYVIEEAGREEPEVINVNAVTFPSGENHFTPLPQLLLKEPHVLAFPDLANGNDLNQMNQLVDEKGLMILTRLPGVNASRILASLLAMKPDVRQFAENLRVVLAMRLIRKLCTNCRVPFPPAPQLVEKLGFPSGRIRQLYRPLILRGNEVDEKGNPVPVCQTCYGTGYLGRTGVFEMFTITDELKKAIASGVNEAKDLHRIATESGQVSMQDELALLVAKGTTSLEEMQRILAPPKS